MKPPRRNSLPRLAAVYYYDDNSCNTIATAKVQGETVEKGADAETVINQKTYKIKILAMASKYNWYTLYMLIVLLLEGVDRLLS